VQRFPLFHEYPVFSLVGFAGRSGLGPEGRRFESFHPDYQKPQYFVEIFRFFRVQIAHPGEKQVLRAMAEPGTGPYRTGDIAEKLQIKVTSLGPRRAKLIPMNSASLFVRKSNSTERQRR